VLFSLVRWITTQHAGKKQIAFIVIALIILLIGVPTIGHLPVHRTNILHSDAQGDVPDPDFDIIQIRSYAQSWYVVLELTVAGLIQTADTNSSYSDFLYEITVVAKGINLGPHIYSCTYQNGIVEQYGFDAEVENSTLRIFFPLAAFISDSYMIGLEGRAMTPFDRDLTSEDRDSPLARLLF
jgi:hypothetical protein